MTPGLVRIFPPRTRANTSRARPSGVFAQTISARAHPNPASTVSRISAQTNSILARPNPRSSRQRPPAPTCRHERTHRSDATKQTRTSAARDFHERFPPAHARTPPGDRGPCASPHSTSLAHARTRLSLPPPPLHERTDPQPGPTDPRACPHSLCTNEPTDRNPSPAVRPRQNARTISHPRSPPHRCCLACRPRLTLGRQARRGPCPTVRESA